MRRFIKEKLIDWKNREDRKPLILKGARQVGKTWVSTKDIEAVNRIQKQILKGYEDDFGKHTDTSNIRSKISIVWESVI